MQPAKQATFSTADLQGYFRATVTDFVGTGQRIGDDARSTLAAVTARLAPRLQDMLAELAASADPTVQQGYLDAVPAIIQAELATFALDELGASRDAASRAIENGLTFALKAAARLLKIAVVA